MALDFQGMQTEVFARGFDDFNDAGAGLVRVKRYINDAMHEVNEAEKWSYTYATTTGVAPFTVADLRKVEAVTDTANRSRLAQADLGSLRTIYADLTASGLAVYWYQTAPTNISVFPLSTVTLAVSYYKFGPDLTANGDVPLMPDRFRQVIVELAVAKLLRDSNAYKDAQLAQAEADRLLGIMRGSMLYSPDAQVLTHGSLDD